MKFSLALKRGLVSLSVVGVLLFGVGGCGDLEASLPPRPTPVPTLPRLPSVTPVTPSPTRAPTATPTLTPTPVPLLGVVARSANVRGGPGINFPIVGVLANGDVVTLLRRSGDWYEVTAPDNLNGWMIRSVLELDPATEAAVPRVVP
ncbi:MAG: SH3 domain-containing protein [Oscillochloridaceae bacterium umkhey_bin13]